MALFKKKKTMDGGSAKEFDKPKLIKETKVSRKAVDEIVKTTDSMNVINASLDHTDATKLKETASTLLRSFDIATKKITSTFDEMVETKKIINNEFLTVQILLTEFEKNASIENIARVIKVFAQEVEAQLSHGRSIRLTNRIVIEPTDYVGKMIPIAKMTQPNQSGINQISWSDISNLLRNGNVINSSEEETIVHLVEAIESNINNGYYMKLGNLVVAKIDYDRSDLMVLFSSDTIVKMNQIYSKDRHKKRKNASDRTNYIEEFKLSAAANKKLDKEFKKKLDVVEKSGDIISNNKSQAVIENEEEYDKKLKDLEEKKKKIENTVNKTIIDIEEGKDIEEAILEQTEIREFEDIKEEVINSATEEISVKSDATEETSNDVADKTEVKEEAVNTDEVSEETTEETKPKKEKASKPKKEKEAKPKKEKASKPKKEKEAKPKKEKEAKPKKEKAAKPKKEKK